MTVRLAAGDATLEVDPDDGGRWTSLRVAGLELLSGTDIPGSYRPTLSGCFPMAPYAGRVREGRLEFRGREHHLPITGAPHAIHGTVLDTAWRVVEADATSVTLSTSLGERWPFAGTATQHLVLAGDRLQARLSVQAEEDMPVTLGLHPWFPRRLPRGSAAELVLAGGRQYARGEDGLPTGELVPPRPQPWDDCFVDLDAPPVVRWPGALELELTSSHGVWVVFTERPDVLCVEPQTGPPDAARLGEADVVAAGQELALDTTLAWRLLEA